MRVALTLPANRRQAGGLPPFDRRPLGDGEPEARACLAALTADGRDLCTCVPHRLDLACPALLGLTLPMSFPRPVRPGTLLVALALLAVAQMAADYAENARVARRLAHPVAEVPAAPAMRLWRRRV
jgi:hypothetical protein